jgi:hypothetical protein
MKQRTEKDFTPGSETAKEFAYFSTKNIIEDLNKSTKCLIDSSGSLKYFFENDAFDENG